MCIYKRAASITANAAAAAKYCCSNGKYVNTTNSSHKANSKYTHAYILTNIQPHMHTLCQTQTANAVVCLATSRC